MASYTGLIIKGIFETLYMVIASTGLGYLFGLPLGVALAVTDENGIKPNKAAYRIMDFIVNIGRSIPFLILLILLIPFTKMIVGKSYGSCTHFPYEGHVLLMVFPGNGISLAPSVLMAGNTP